MFVATANVLNNALINTKKPEEKANERNFSLNIVAGMRRSRRRRRKSRILLPHAAAVCALDCRGTLLRVPRAAAVGALGNRAQFSACLQSRGGGLDFFCRSSMLLAPRVFVCLFLFYRLFYAYISPL